MEESHHFCVAGLLNALELGCWGVGSVQNRESVQFSGLEVAHEKAVVGEAELAYGVQEAVMVASEVRRAVWEDDFSDSVRSSVPQDLALVPNRPFF